MTLPVEKVYAIVNARDFLYDLLDRKKTPRVPLKVRLRARDVLKHYPTNNALAGLENYFNRTEKTWLKNPKKASSKSSPAKRR